MKKILLVLSLILCLFFLTCCEDGKVSADKIKQAGDALAKTGNSAEAQRIIVENAQTEVEELVEELDKLINLTENSVKGFTADSTSSPFAKYDDIDDILQKFNSLSAKYSHNDEAWEIIRAYLYEDNLQDGEQSIITEKFKALCDDANAYAREEGVALLKTLLLFLLDYNDVIEEELDYKLNTFPISIRLNLSLRDFLEGMKTQFYIEKPNADIKSHTITYSSYFNSLYDATSFKIYQSNDKTKKETDALKAIFTSETNPKLSSIMKVTNNNEEWYYSLALGALDWVIESDGLTSLIKKFTNADVGAVIGILSSVGLKPSTLPIYSQYATVEHEKIKLTETQIIDNKEKTITFENRLALQINEKFKYQNKYFVVWENSNSSSTTISLGTKYSYNPGGGESSKPSIPGTSNPTDVTMDGITDDAISTLLSMLLSMYGEVLTDYGDGKLYSVASLLNDLYFINALATVETVMGELSSSLNNSGDFYSQLFNGVYADFFSSKLGPQYTGGKALTYDSFATKANLTSIVKLLLEISKGNYVPADNTMLSDEDFCKDIVAMSILLNNISNIKAETVLKYFNEIEGIASNLDSAMKYNKNLYTYNKKTGQTAYQMSKKVQIIFDTDVKNIPAGNIIALITGEKYTDKNDSTNTTYYPTDPSETLSYALHKIDDNEIVDAIRYNLTNKNLNLDIDSFLDGTIEKLLKSLDM